MENNEKIDDKGWLKNLLNNNVLLKFVKKFSADNLMTDNSLAEKFGIKCNEESISVGDNTLTKLLVTSARFEGNEYCRFNLKQLRETLDLTGAEGELVISSDNNKELFVIVKDTITIVSPLPQTDKQDGKQDENE